MTPEELKKSIYQLAIQGKLVEQLHEEGNASSLAKDIRRIKDGLIAEGKIPKEKKLPDITEDEMVFDLPDNWCYVRVQDIANYITDYVANGSFATLKEHTKTYKTPNYALFVRTMDLTNNFQGECSYIDKASYDYLEKSRLYGGELILPNIGGSIGKAFLMPDMKMPMSLAPNSILLKFEYMVMNKYFSYLIQSPYGAKLLADTKGGTATPKFSKTELRMMVVPLPPLEEQKRIVAKIEELLPLVDKYADAYNRLEELNKAFPGDLKKSILQYAIQGKLVEQRPEEGNADDLYAQIQADKQKLIKEGKIKKEKPLPEITDDEIPFDIPESWRWVHIGDVFQHNTGKAQNSSAVSSGVIRKFITTSNLYWNRFDFSKIKEMPFTEKEVERCSVRKGDLLVCEGGDCGRSAIWTYDEEMCIQNHVHRLRPYSTVSVEYFYHIFYLYKHMGLLQGRGVGIQGLSTNALHMIICPLPPLEEQKRIVKSIDLLFASFNALKG